MRKTLFSVIFFCILSGFTLPTIADEITIAGDEWAPYNSKPDALKPGYGIEIAKLIFEAVGHKVTYTVIPWTRAVKLTRKGKYNAIIGAYKEDAPDFVFPEEEFGLSKNAFFAIKETTWKYTGLDSLQTIKVGLVKDYSVGEKLDNFFKANKNIVQYVHGSDPLKANILKLIAGRMDVLVEDENVLLLKAKTMGVADQLMNVGNISTGELVYIAFSPNIAKSKEYAEILTKGIRQLKTSGELDDLLAKYGLHYWK